MEPSRGLRSTFHGTGDNSGHDGAFARSYLKTLFLETCGEAAQHNRKEIDDVTLDELRRERDSVANRISGVKTQLRRLSDDDGQADIGERRRYLEERLETLLRRRGELSEAILHQRREHQRARDRGEPIDVAA